MLRWKGLLAMATLTAASLGGCSTPLNLLNPDFAAAIGLGEQVASLPGDAPGLLVTVQNRTSRWVGMTVSFRDGNNNVDQFTETLAPMDNSGQMLPCPITEITLGDVANLQQSGAVVYLADLSTTTNNQGTAVTAENAPFVAVEPFGTLLREGVNYDCGDKLIFVVEPSGATLSGFQTLVYIRRSGTGQ